VLLGLAPAKAQSEYGQHCSFEIPEDRHERQPGGGERSGTDEHCGAATRPTATKRTGDDRGRPESAERPADRAADGLVPIEGEQADDDTCDDRDEHRNDETRYERRAEDPERRAEADDNSDRVPGTHRRDTLVPPQVVPQCLMSNSRGNSHRTLLPNATTTVLLFFSSARSGPSRRMESLLAHIARKERHRLRVVQIDVDERREIADKLGVAAAPTLVLVRGKAMIARIEGRASAPRIEAMLEEHLGEAVAAA
jgi:Thioredoxin